MKEPTPEFLALYRALNRRGVDRAMPGIIADAEKELNAFLDARDARKAKEADDKFCRDHKAMNEVLDEGMGQG